MSMSSHIKPISYLKANAAQIAEELKQDGAVYVITQNGEAAMVVQSVEEYERKENTIAMLQMIALGQREIGQGHTEPLGAALAGIRSRLGLNE